MHGYWYSICGMFLRTKAENIPTYVRTQLFSTYACAIICLLKYYEHMYCLCTHGVCTYICIYLNYCFDGFRPSVLDKFIIFPILLFQPISFSAIQENSRSTGSSETSILSCGTSETWFSRAEIGTPVDTLLASNQNG